MSKEKENPIETRIYAVEGENFRAYTEDDKMIVEGLFIPYNVQSRLVSEKGKIFNEVIERGAASGLINDKPDVYMTYNHSINDVVARTTNGTLKLTETDNGVYARAILNNTTASKDLYERISRKDITENSFAFRVADENLKWEFNAEGVPLRRVLRFTDLIDVSPVVKAAYPKTSVYARGLDEFESKLSENENINKEHLNDMGVITKIIKK
jgi:uncharacterized protein